MGTDRIKGHLDALLLAILGAGQAHGYEVIAELKRRSEGEFDMAEGTVYPSLHKLEARGLLTSEWDRAGGRRRRLYRLTAEGERVLVAERSAWHRFSLGMNSILGATS